MLPRLQDATQLSCAAARQTHWFCHWLRCVVSGGVLRSLLWRTPLPCKPLLPKAADCGCQAMKDASRCGGLFENNDPENCQIPSAFLK
ncbi:hypothetical protein Q5P01_019153 [Channa striata]|uniref:Uncharacterized protein n=1 Tax=Channa striata TaxID=64152 RepID=A0AA88SDE9_CHASR|nr:hypothetical protein Q5P01_019153 [Channa striata]